MLRVLLLVATFFFVHNEAFAGVVNSQGGFPFAAINSRGDAIFGGDLKLRVSWRGDFLEQRESAAPFRFSEAAGDVFSGGISESTRAGEPTAIICSQKRMALYFAERSSSNPAGFWKEISELAGVSWGDNPISCAMREDGVYAVLYKKTGKILVSNGLVTQLGSIGSGGVFSILASGAHFVAVATRQIWSFSADNYISGVITPSSLPFVSTSELTRFVANSSLLMKADSSSVELSKVSISSDGSLSFSKGRRLGISPCGDNEMCGAWLARDNSFSVSGWWGTFVGKESGFARLDFPSLSGGKGAVAFVHAGVDGRYVYIGADDSDWGNLPAGLLAASPDFLVNSSSRRWIVWTKIHSNSLEENANAFMMDWYLGRKSFGFNGANNTHRERLGVQVYKGALPRVIPKSWVAWEPEVLFPALQWKPEPSSFLSGTDWWWRSALGVDGALSAAKDAGVSQREVVVGIVDSGVQIDHPWLVNSFAKKASEIPENGIDDDGNGFVDDVFGYDFVNENAVPLDLFGHGTHVAGLIAARDPASGDAVAFNINTRIKVARALDRYGKSNSIDLARAIVYLAHEGVDILNCSWGGGAPTQALRDAFSFAQSSGVMVFSSAGNDRMDTDKSPQVPKMFPGVVSVGAFTQAGKLAPFSNWGAKSVHWMAPGDKIMSTLPGSLVGEKSGTSMASPIAVNLASWILGILEYRFPNFSRELLHKPLLQTVCSTAAGSGVEGKSACGRIRGFEATQSALLIDL